MFWGTHYDNQPINLQGVLAQATSDTSYATNIKGPHHPIGCLSSDPIYLDEDGTMRCPHSTAGPDCPRNQALQDATMAILLIELAVQKYAPSVR